MKRKTIFFIMLTSLIAILSFQSCKKEGSPTKDFVAAMPSEPSPIVNAIIPYVNASQTVTLTWTGTGSLTTTWTVYFGKSPDPPKVATNVSGNTYTAATPTGGVYYWKVSQIDANNVSTTSDIWSFDVNTNPNAPSGPAPAVNATGVANSPTLAWSDSDPDGDVLTYDLVLDTIATPTKVVATGIADTSYTFTTLLKQNTVYYWKIVAHDPYGGTSTGPIWSFKTGALPIAKYTGNYNADEPAEAYSYPVAFALKDATTITCDNYWNSGWVVDFTLDLTNLTYTFPVTTFQAGWTGTESGIIEPATGKMVGSYTIWHNGAISEQGVHTYTKL
jgi:hypothetical protein